MADSQPRDPQARDAPDHADERSADDPPAAGPAPPRKPSTKPGKRTKKPAKERPLPGAVPSRFRSAWVVVAALYLVTVWLDGVGATWPAKMTPRPWLYLAQVAALFVNAAPKVIDYRAEGWSCSERRWTEIDTRPMFRIDADNKENRFQRALQFYRKNRTVMRALEDYIVKREAAAGTSLGGVRFSSLRLPYPAPGEHVDPFTQKPLSTYSGEQKHDWYWTPRSRRLQRCGLPDPNDGAKDDDGSSNGSGSSSGPNISSSGTAKDPPSSRDSNDKELDP